MSNNRSIRSLRVFVFDTSRGDFKNKFHFYPSFSSLPSDTFRVVFVLNLVHTFLLYSFFFSFTDLLELPSI